MRRALHHVFTALILVGLSGCGVLHLDVNSSAVVSFSQCALLATATSHKASGSGTATDPYILCWPAQLASLAATSADWNASYQLVNDIDLQTVAFTPIGNSTTPFEGTFDGNGHTITSLVVNQTADNAGLFGYLDGPARIRNLTLDHPKVSGVKNVGAVAGAMNYGVVQDVSVIQASTAGLTNVGGAVGSINGGAGIVRVHVSGVTNGSSAFGEAIGGVVGYCYNSELFAVSSSGTVENGTDVGGIVGNSSCAINDSKSDGSIFGLANIGGVIGTATASNVITRSYSSANVSGLRAGGAVGENLGTLTEVYTSGVVTGATSGGIIGDNQGSFTNVYWDTQKSGKASACGSASASCSSVTGLTSSQTLTASNFGSWDFAGASTDGTRDTWVLTGGNAPKLWWEDQTFKAPLTLKGSGTFADPFKITSAADFEQLGASANPRVYNAFYVIANDLDFSAVASHDMVGTSAESFRGSIEGGAHTIRNLTLNGTNFYIGLIGYGGWGSSLSNFAIENGSITGTSTECGLFAAYEIGFATNLNVSGAVTCGGMGALMFGHFEGFAQHLNASGTINDDGGDVGGIAGQNYGTSAFDDVQVNVTINANSGGDIGGIAGYSQSSTQEPVRYSNCRANVTMNTANANTVGGLGGDGSAAITNSTVTGLIQGNGDVGGLFGELYGGSITNSNVNATINGQDYTGGLLGDASSFGAIASSHYNGQLTCGGYCGGLVGEGSLESLTNSSSAGTLITTATNVNTFGGLGGEPDITTVANVTSSMTIDVTAAQQIYALGGLFGSANITSMDTVSFTGTFLFGGSINYVDEVGGIAGSLNGGPVSNASTAQVVSLTTDDADGIGGFVGYLASGALSNISSPGVLVHVTSYGDDIGGIAGYEYTNLSTLDRLVVNGPVRVTYDPGGYAYDIGGLFGGIQGATITNSHIQGDVDCQQTCGGLVGDAENSSIQTSYAIGNVSGEDQIGGLVGYSDPVAISDSFSVGNITGILLTNTTSSEQCLGGLAGYVDDATFTRSYSVGIIQPVAGLTGTPCVAGVTGYDNGAADQSRYVGVVYNVTKNPTLAGTGTGAFGTNGTPTGVTAASTAAMTSQTPSIYSAWDFTSVWKLDSASVNGGYPLLRSGGL